MSSISREKNDREGEMGKNEILSLLLDGIIKNYYLNNCLSDGKADQGEGANG